MEVAWVQSMCSTGGLRALFELTGGLAFAKKKGNFVTPEVAP